MNTLLLAPEILSSEGGIPRILQLYLRALCELAGPDDEIRLVALNDATFDPEELQRLTGGRLTEAFACGRDKLHFLRTTLRFARRSDRIICGHVAQLPIALVRSKKQQLLRNSNSSRPLRLVWLQKTLPELNSRLKIRPH
jgi:hypothetical protein